MPDFCADVLAFTIAVGPDEEIFGISSLALNVAGHSLLAFFYEGQNLCFEKDRWLAVPPALIARVEIMTEQVAKDRGHGHVAVAPSWKVVLKVEVLDVDIALDIALLYSQSDT